jgi:site-specific DNA recombinase
MAQQKRAVIYLRVSGKKQDTMTQLIDCREYCEVHNLEIVEEIPDKISGNSSVIERSGGARVYELLRNKTADLVLLWKIDRVTRDEDITEYMVFKRDVKRIGAELHFCDIGRTSDDPMGAISEFSQAAGAAKERLNIIERTSKGRRKKFNYEKRLVLNGEAPFGYHKIGIQREAQLVIDDVESAIVRDVFRWYVTDRLDLWEILKRVSASGTKPRRTVVWNKRKMIQILHYQEYKGTFKYSGQTMVKPELTIIDSDTWESAQMFLKGNQWLHDKTGKYLMAGRVKCTCDHTLTGSSADKLHYYRCHQGWSYPPGSEQRCKQARIRVEKIDKTVWGG